MKFKMFIKIQILNPFPVKILKPYFSTRLHSLQLSSMPNFEPLDPKILENPRSVSEWASQWNLFYKNIQILWKGKIHDNSMIYILCI